MIPIIAIIESRDLCVLPRVRLRSSATAQKPTYHVSHFTIPNLLSLYGNLSYLCIAILIMYHCVSSFDDNILLI